MRVFYLDAGLRDDLGHHAQSCREISKALRARGIDVRVFSLRDILPSLKDELRATPTFRIRTYDGVDVDPLCGHLVNFEAKWRSMIEDMKLVTGFTRDDIVYFNSVQPAQYMAAVRWYMSVHVSRRPTVVIEFGTDAGVDSALDLASGTLSFSVRNFWHDPQPLFYRYAGRQMAPDPRFILSTFDAVSSKVYQELTGHPTRTLPVPRFADVEPFSRAGRRPITVSVMGHQRYDKGYHLVPQVARMLLSDCPDIRLLIHNGFPQGMPDVQALVRSLAVDPRVTISEEVAGPDLWGEMLSVSDLIVSPYMHNRFSASYSAVTAEALAHAIPLVVPANTSLSRLVDDFGGACEVFLHHEPNSIVAATKRAIARFDELATTAMSGAAKWRTLMGAGNMVDSMLAAARGPSL